VPEDVLFIRRGGQTGSWTTGILETFSIDSGSPAR